MEFNLRKALIIGGGLLSLILIYVISGGFMEEIDAREVVVIQTPFTGKLNIYKKPGAVFQWWGTVTHYSLRKQFWFISEKVAKKLGKKDFEGDRSIKVRFADGGHADISGSISWEMPMDDPSIILLHTKYGSMESIEQMLIGTIMNKSIYMSGPIMTSKESYAERRNDLLGYIEDQALHGVYQTRQKEIKGLDPITGQEKTYTVVEIRMNDKGLFIRQEKSPAQTYHILLSNLSINEIDYDNTVEKQIQKQQDLTMQVQTSIANAKKSEQDAITAAKKGEADAMKAKWDQEVIKAKLVTEAQQKKEVAKLEMEAAEFTKQREINLGQGEGERKRLNQTANGSLELKIEAAVKINKYWAEAFSKYQGSVVPYNFMGQSSFTPGSPTYGGNAAVNFMELITAKTMQEFNKISTK